MDKLVYLVYPVMLIILLWGARVMKRGEWNEEALSLRQTKALQGFTALCIMLHHIGQKLCASWLAPNMIIPGLEFFVPIGYMLVGIFLFFSGYGLYKSYCRKENYFEGFLKKHLIPLFFVSYVVIFMFGIFRMIQGEKLTGESVFYYLTQLKLCNVNGWYMVTLPLFYLFFYLAFRFCKKEAISFVLIFLLVLGYITIGTCMDHNGWMLQGEWWYNSAHFFPIGLLFARFEKPVVAHMKKYYPVYLILAIILMVPLYVWSEMAQGIFGYYGETFHASDTVQRRWISLLSQMAASFVCVFAIFLAGFKLKISNKIIDFMGTITLEFYLVHGLFVELFSYSFVSSLPPIYRITNPWIYILTVLALSLPIAWILHKIVVKLKGKL